MKSDNGSLREHLNGLTAKLYEQAEFNKELRVKMEQDSARHIMFLTSLLLAHQDGKGDPKRTMELLKSKISSVIKNHE